MPKCEKFETVFYAKTHFCYHTIFMLDGSNFLLVSSNCKPSSSPIPGTGKQSRLGNNNKTTTAGTGCGNKAVNHSRSSQKPAKGLGNKMPKPKDAGT